MIDINELKGLYPFNKLDHREINKILGFSKVETLRKGKYLIYQGDYPDCIYFILRGKITLYKWVSEDKDKPVRELGLGSWIGISEVFLGESYFFDIKADEEIVVLKFSSSYINEILNIEEINISIIENLSRWNSFFNRSLQEKSCYQLLEEFITESEDGIIDITQDKLAEKLGFTRECVNKNLKKMEARGVITLGRSKIIKQG